MKQAAALLQIPCHSLPCLRSGSKLKLELVSTSGSEVISTPVLKTKHVYLLLFFHALHQNAPALKKKYTILQIYMSTLRAESSDGS